MSTSPEVCVFQCLHKSYSAVRPSFTSPVVGDAEVELLPDDLRLFPGYLWQILANPGYFLATVWLILATLG